MEGEYTARDIVVLSGTQGVRKRPAMYIGSTGSAGFLHLLWEVLDNSVDEAIAGYCKNITITLTNEEGVDVCEVSDDGRGIPVSSHSEEGMTVLEKILTSLHAGAKFDNKAYKVSGGLHGVGLTVVNALSEYTEVSIKREDKRFVQRFSRGEPVTKLEIAGDVEQGERGTTIKFKPDMQIFSATSFDTIELNERLKDLSFLNPGITINLVDKRGAQEKLTTYHSDAGMADFIAYIRGSKEPLTKQLQITKKLEGVEVGAYFQYVNGYSEELLSFVNNIKTHEGGSHVAGFHSALTRAITNYMQHSKTQQKVKEIEGSDTREGLIVIISVLMQNPEFEGQTKEKLGNPKIKGIMDNIVYDYLARYMEENPSEAAKIISKVASAAEARESAKRARELVRKKSIFEGSVLPGKLADCTDDDPEKTEIFLVEGASAAGSSKEGRDRFFQAILPLRGKILNVEKASDEKFFNNEVLRTIVTAFGVGIKESFNPDKLRYSKVIILADADVDGSHIRTLLLTLFYRYMRPLVDRGKIYIAQPPLYRITHGKESKYAFSDAELNEALKKYDGKAGVQRYKGLGEMNPEQLWETTMNPATRVLKKIKVKDAIIADTLFSVLMGLDVEKRRLFLEEHASEVSFLDI